MSLLFETILIDKGKPVNLFYHERRMNAARKHFWNVFPINLIENIPADIPVEGKYRCRIEYEADINSIITKPFEGKKVNTLKIVRSERIEYSFKYCDRRELDFLFGLRGDADDILIIKEGLITDTSAANIVFTDGEKFYTPSSPLLKGTERARLLAEGILEEKLIKHSDIPLFSGWQHINALNRFDPGRFISTNCIYHPS
jgi:4-amino-4-deoxychorismate lyase